MVYRDGGRGERRTHDIHATQLGPDLGEQADLRAIEHLLGEEVEVGDMFVSSLEFTHVPNVLHLEGDERGVSVSFGMDACEYFVAFLPPVMAGEPSRGLGQHQHSYVQEESRNHLQAPGKPPGRGAVIPGLVAADV